jgi:hypothetical protein
MISSADLARIGKKATRASAGTDRRISSVVCSPAPREAVADRQQRAEPPRRPVEDRQRDAVDIPVVTRRQRRGVAIEQVGAVIPAGDAAAAGRIAAGDAHRAP